MCLTYAAFGSKICKGHFEQYWYGAGGHGPGSGADYPVLSLRFAYRCILGEKKEEASVSFADVNLYDHSLNDAIVELSLRGRQKTVTNQELAPDLSTRGCFPKAWVRREDGFVLLKDGGDGAVERELLASQIARCFSYPQVLYEEAVYDGEKVSESRLITSKRYSIVSKMAFDIYAANHDLDTLEECRRLDARTYYGMNILDYLVGNTDRHPENWGFLIDSETNQYLSLYPIYGL